MAAVGREGSRALISVPEEAITRRPAPPPACLGEVDEESGSPTERREKMEQFRKAKVMANLELGCMVAVFGFAVLSGWLCLPEAAKHPSNTRSTAPPLLAFATFISGKCLMLLSMNLLGLPESLISGGQRVASRCLFVMCIVLSTVTLASLVLLLPGRVYLYAGLAVITVVALSAAAVHWHLGRRADGGSEAAMYEEHGVELDAVFKITSSVTNSAFGGLVGVLYSASKISGQTRAAYAAIFFMFATAIAGMFLMTVSKRVLEITNRRLRRLLIGAIRLANAILLCSLACGAFAASFVVLGFRMFAAFAPFVFTGLLYLLLLHCIGRRGRANSEDQMARIKAMEDIAIKVMVATLAAIMSALGGSLGKNNQKEMGWRPDVFMVFLTSSFVSGFGFMLLAALPGSALARLAPAAKVLVWSPVSLFLATAIVACGMELR